MPKAVLPPIQRPMDETVEAMLCTVYRVSSGDELPEEIHAAYHNLKVASERLSSSITAEAFLYAIIVASGVPVPIPPPTFVDYIRRGMVSVDDPLMVKWRNKWEPATYQGYQGGMVRVDMEGNERALSPDLVKFAEDAVPA